MAVKNHKFKFDKTFNIKGTADLKPSLDVKLDCEFPLEDSEISLAAKIEKNFAKEYEKLIKAQMAHFEKWLKEKQKYIDEAKALEKSIQKMAVPKNEGEFKKLGAALNKLDDMKDYISDLKADFDTLAQGWAQNVIDQQAEIAILAAKKKAGAQMLQAKKTRMVLGKVVRGLLVVSAVAVGIAALVLSAGTAAPLVIGLGAAAAALGGLGSLAAFGKTVHRDADLEKKVLKNVEGDLKKIAAAIKPVAGSGIVKHTMELDVIIKQRKSELAKMKMDLKKSIVQIDAQIKAGADLMAAKGIDNVLNDKEFKKMAAKYADLKKEAQEIGKKIDKAQAVVLRGEKLSDDLRDLGVKLDEFGSYFESNTIGSNLKTYFTSVDGYIELAKSLGAFRPGAGLAG